MNKLYYIIYLLIFSACGSPSGKNQSHTRTVTDALRREVSLPDTIQRVICIRASAIRLVTYAGGAPFICGVEEQETRNNAYPHTLAHPELQEKTIIGPPMGGDAELIMAAQPDLIFMSTTTVGDADNLQKRTGIPVITLEYGDIGKKREVFYQSLRLIGDVLHTRPHTDSLIGFIDNQIAELQQRTKNQHAYPRVYVGGISYKGQKGLTSTDPYYAAFQFLGVDNVASSIDSTFVSPITGTFIDWEQLADWNPEVIFLDISGLPLIEEEFKSRKKANQLLTAYKNKQIYTLWPYNDSHSNFEVMLINAWYAGKVLFPNQFHDIIIREKADEILAQFTGQPIGLKLQARWGDYRNIFEENYGQ